MQLFVEYNVPWLRKEFGLQFSLLLDTLHVFTAGSAELVLRYPGVNQELICECVYCPRLLLALIRGLQQQKLHCLAQDDRRRR